MKTLRFMGQVFADREELRKVFPAFAGEDAVRAMQKGATTPLEVEVSCWEHRNAGYIKARAAAQRTKVREFLTGLAKGTKRHTARAAGRKAA